MNIVGKGLSKIPIFNSFEEIINLSDSLCLLDSAAFAQFEQANTFKSMHTCFEEIVRAEIGIANNLELSGNTNSAIFNTTHSALLNTYSGSYVVKTMSDGGLFLEVNAPYLKWHLR